MAEKQEDFDKLLKLKIKSRSELKKLLKSLEEQGFGYQYDWNFHNRKVDEIISNANKLGVKLDSEIKEKLSRLDNYDEIEKEANKFFSKYNPEDKIFELFNNIYLSEDDVGRIPYSRPDNKEVIEWFKFRKKYNLLDIYNPGTNFHAYNLDKNMLKIRCDETYKFRELYKLILNEECLEFNSKYGVWQNLGKIEIKLFMNNYANIKGPGLKEFKNYYYKYIKNKDYGNNIIIYNKKQEVIYKERE